ncbi:hypothetical protein [Actinoplanes sp. DH11]|uniref:hypothetical protein n=1 Tax=Actinoplanes sp. DH11 TaxID=2857011 RepID=UPI001E6204D2|nr:hypothetical protein [Actinoplanes sp. DH11]
MKGLIANHSTAELDFAQQRTVRRSPLFTRLPIVIIFLLALNAIWEVYRLNATTIQFSVMERSTSFTLIGVGAGLLLTRLQWARAMRPALGIAIDPEDGHTRESTSKWILRAVNAGPGVPVIEKFDYHISFEDADRLPTDSDFVDFVRLAQILRKRGMKSEVDYYVKYLTRGGPLPVSNYAAGTEVCWFSQSVLHVIKRLDIRVRVVDIAGDTHERIFPCKYFLEGVLADPGKPKEGRIFKRRRPS